MELKEIHDGLLECFGWFDDNLQYADTADREKAKEMVLYAFDLLGHLQDIVDGNKVTIEKFNMDLKIKLLNNEKNSLLRQIQQLKNEQATQNFRSEYDRQNRR